MGDGGNRPDWGSRVVGSPQAVQQDDIKRILTNTFAPGYMVMVVGLGGETNNDYYKSPMSLERMQQCFTDDPR